MTANHYNDTTTNFHTFREEAMSIADIKRAIDDKLSPQALGFWNGCSYEAVEDILHTATEHGIDAAVAELESLVK